MKPRPVLDARLPDKEFSHHAPFWWGSTLMITIEGAGLAILVVTYFYVRQNFDVWPPSGTLVPDLGASTLDVAILVVSVLPMWYVAKLGQRHDRSRLIGAGAPGDCGPWPAGLTAADSVRKLASGWLAGDLS